MNDMLQQLELLSFRQRMLNNLRGGGDAPTPVKEEV